MSHSVGGPGGTNQTRPVQDAPVTTESQGQQPVEQNYIPRAPALERKPISSYKLSLIRHPRRYIALALTRFRQGKEVQNLLKTVNDHTQSAQARDHAAQKLLTKACNKQELNSPSRMTTYLARCPLLGAQVREQAVQQLFGLAKVGAFPVSSLYEAMQGVRSDQEIIATLSQCTQHKKPAHKAFSLLQKHLARHPGLFTQEAAEAMMQEAGRGNRKALAALKEHLDAFKAAVPGKVSTLHMMYPAPDPELAAGNLEQLHHRDVTVGKGHLVEPALSRFQKMMNEYAETNNPDTWEEGVKSLFYAVNQGIAPSKNKPDYKPVCMAIQFLENPDNPISDSLMLELRQKMTGLDKFHLEATTSSDNRTELLHRCLNILEESENPQHRLLTGLHRLNDPLCTTDKAFHSLYQCLGVKPRAIVVHQQDGLEFTPNPQSADALQGLLSLYPRLSKQQRTQLFEAVQAISRSVHQLTFTVPDPPANQ